MAFAYFDRVKETSTTAGLGAITLAGAVGGFQAFSARYANGDTLHYTITHPNGSWEVGLGTWLTGSQLARTTVLASSNSGALVNFAAGTKEVFVTHPAVIESLMGARFFAVADQTARDAIPTAALRPNMICLVVATSAFFRWNGASWAVFGGFAPTGTATGQAQIWNQSLGTWQAGSLDLADPDAVGSSILGPNNGGTGIAGAGGTPNRVLLTTNGTSWAAGLVNLATMVTGALALTGLAAAAGFSVLGKATTGSGDRADIVAAQVGQVLRRDASGLSFGALDLADPDSVAGILPGTNVNPSFGSQNILTSGTLSAGKTALTPAVETSGSPFALRVTGAAHTTLTAATEVVDLDFNLARTVQRATGAVSVQRAARFSAPTYSFVGASVISDAATVAITGAPVAGANATLTRSYALWVQAGSVRFQGLGAGVVQTDANGVLSSSTLAATSVAPGTDGQVFITTAGNAAWGNDLGAGSLTTTGYFGGLDTAVSAATGGAATFRAGDATSATGGVGGAVTLRAGDATGGSGTRTGGALTLRSGTGASGPGDVNIQRGSSTAFSSTATSTFLDHVSTITLRINATTNVVVGSSAMTLHVRDYLWNDTVATPRLMQQTTASATGQLLTLAAQDTLNTTTAVGGALVIRAGDATGASGTRTGGSLLIRSGTGASGGGSAQLMAGTLNVIDYGATQASTLTVGDALGTANWYRVSSGGLHSFRIGSNQAASINSTVFELTAPPTFRWATAVASPTITQVDNVTVSGTGSTLTVSAQSATNTTSTGGALELRSGAGTTAAGNVNLRTGSTLKLQITPLVVSLSNPTLRFDSLQVSPLVAQETSADVGVIAAAFTVAAQDITGNSSRGGNMTLRAGDASGSTGTRTGGNLLLRSGTGFDVASAASPGNVTIQRGATVVAQWVNTTSDFISQGPTTDVATTGNLRWGTGTYTIMGRTASADVQVLGFTGGASPTIAIGPSTSAITLLDMVAGTLQVRASGTLQLGSSTSSQILLSGSAMNFAIGCTPTFQQVVNNTASVTGQPFVISAQAVGGNTLTVGGALTINAGNATGAGGTHTGGAMTLAGGDATGGSGVRTGGALLLRSGTGATNAGALTLQRGSTSVFSATDGGSGSTAISMGTTNGAITLRAGGAIDYYVYMTYDQGTTRYGWDNINFYQGASVAPGDVSFSKNGQGFFSFGHDGSNAKRIGFFGTTGGTQAADPGLLTGAFGTTGSAIADVTGSHNQSILNNNFRALQDTVNRMRTLLRGYGLAA